MVQIMNVSSILSESIKMGLSERNEASTLPNLLHLALLHTANLVLYVLLESIDLELLKLARCVYKAIGNSEDYLGMADWIVI